MSIPDYDVVVVGAGPAGASAARAACKSGISVLLVDARHTPGSPVQCAEYVPSIVKSYVPLVKKAVIQKIDSLVTFVNDELVSILAGPGYMLDRVVFDGSMVQSAREAGAEFWAGTKALSFTDRGLIFSRSDQGEVEIKCKVIIGADGPRSTVGRWMNSVNGKYMVGLQYNMPLVQKQTTTDVYFNPEYKGGYGWVFPKGGRANVGVGINLADKGELPGLVNKFIRSLVARGILADVRTAMKTAGLIPIGGPLEVTQAGNMLLAGDAGGYTHPVTGGGIMNAIVTGQMAGETAAKAVRSHDLELLSLYPQQCHSYLGRFLTRATQQRQDMDNNWTDDREQFAELIRRTWLSFN
jgi:digeranylgeranylglycerophospholipid reductase